MEQETLHEITTYYININKNEEAPSAWHNSMLAVRSEKGLHFYELAHNIACLDKKINCLQTYLPAVKSKNSSELFTDKVINNSMNNMDYTEMIQDQTLWPHNPQLVEEMTCVVSFEWSPAGLLPKKQSVLAVLNNIGGIDLFKHYQSKWEHVHEIAASFSETFKKSLKEPREFSELKEAAHILASTAMCWAPTLVACNCCYMATAQKNDSIMFWLVMYNNGIVTTQFQGSIESGEGEIVALKWITKSENNFLLICSNIFGQIILLECVIKHNIVQLKDSLLIWTDKDRMISRQLQYTIIDDKITIICNKHRHLVVLMIDEHFNVCGQYVHNINDYRITCITHSRNDIYVATVNYEIYKINISVNDDTFDVTLCPIVFYNLNPNCELFSVSFSHNGVLCTLVTIDRRINFRKQSTKLNIVFATYNKTLTSLVHLLLENPTNQLTDYWDVIELLRYKCMKNKEAPPVSYYNLYEAACRNIYLLKLYYIFVTFYTNLRNLFKINPIPNIPEDSIETIKEEILVIHAEVMFRKYNDKRLSEGQLHGLEKESLLGSMNFLEDYCKKNNRNLSDILSFDKSNLGEMCMYTCQGCDEKLQGFTCKSYHLNIFCSLTFTPIESLEYLYCKWCNRTARIELAPESPKCLICDVYLE